MAGAVIIVGGLIGGLSMKAAVEYSFLLGVLTLTAATTKKAIWKVDGLGEQYHGGSGRDGKSADECRRIFAEHIHATPEQVDQIVALLGDIQTPAKAPKSRKKVSA